MYNPHWGDDLKEYLDSKVIKPYSIDFEKKSIFIQCSGLGMKFLNGLQSIVIIHFVMWKDGKFEIMFDAY